jgi:hypothetical protein
MKRLVSLNRMLRLILIMDIFGCYKANRFSSKLAICYTFDIVVAFGSTSQGIRTAVIRLVKSKTVLHLSFNTIALSHPASLACVDLELSGDSIRLTSFMSGWNPLL